MHYNSSSSHQTAISVNDSLRISSHDEMHPRACYAWLGNIFSTYEQNSGALQNDLMENVDIKLY